MDKAMFCKMLSEFWKKVDALCGIACLQYAVEGDDEWVYVLYNAGGKKKFCVTADSYKGMVKDFIKFLDNKDDYRWLFD